MADINIGQITEALNDKMDRDVGNAAVLGKERIVSFGIPDYSRGIEYTSNATGTLDCDSKVIVTTSVQTYNYGRFVIFNEDRTVAIDEVRAYGKSFSDGKGIASVSSGYFPKGSNFTITLSSESTTNTPKILIYPLKGTPND